MSTKEDSKEGKYYLFLGNSSIKEWMISCSFSSIAIKSNIYYRTVIALLKMNLILLLLREGEGEIESITPSLCSI